MQETNNSRNLKLPGKMYKVMNDIERINILHTDWIKTLELCSNKSQEDIVYAILELKQYCSVKNKELYNILDAMLCMYYNSYIKCNDTIGEKVRTLLKTEIDKTNALIDVVQEAIDATPKKSAGAQTDLKYKRDVLEEIYGKVNVMLGVHK